jgi:hypothetical protein
MSDETSASYCFECKRPLVEIDNRRWLHDVQYLVVAHGRRDSEVISGGSGCAACYATGKVRTPTEADQEEAPAFGETGARVVTEMALVLLTMRPSGTNGVAQPRAARCNLRQRHKGKSAGLW